jgi:hypothetical protein
LADLSDTIETLAEGKIASSTIDGNSATAQPIAGLIQADQYLAAKTAASKRRRGIRFSKIINPGALSDAGGTLGGTCSYPGGW